MAFLHATQYKILILSRYILKQLIATTAGVAAVLLLIIMSSRFSRYLGDAAAGKLAADILFPIMGYRFPGFFELILPLSFFIALLMVYGRLYSDSEMAVLNACGISPHKMFGLAFSAACGVALIVGLISLYVSPWGASHVEKLIQQQSGQSITHLAPGQFHQQRSRGSVIYMEPGQQDQDAFGNVFISQVTKSSAADPSLQSTLITAQTGSFFTSEKTHIGYLTVKNGFHLQGTAGQLDYRSTHFEKLNHRYSEPSPELISSKRDSVATSALFSSSKTDDIALLQWRLSLPFIAPIICLIAFPLSKINPRQGRFARIFPAIILYLSYLMALSFARTAIEKGDLAPYPGIWSVHLLYFTIGLLLYFGLAIKRTLFNPAIQHDSGKG